MEQALYESGPRQTLKPWQGKEGRWVNPRFMMQRSNRWRMRMAAADLRLQNTASDCKSPC